ncbi:alkaline phosphatase [Marinicauda salina]|uniref:Alkaline phosphatase n=1 Tax=Marinicauda salina TaxID=2135793 RepID=A0A2U2BX93_9PROT|nr:alkaline phosphatase D family protein [Marinicauda salina]PWE18638.1 alkaline phosphatase [Marinicauda salina]
MDFDGLTRRDALIGGAGLGLAACGEERFDPPPAREGPFKHGVAAGDPDQTSLVLWTAVTDPAEPVGYEIATDEAFSQIVYAGELGAAGPATNGATPMKAVVAGLEPGRTYFYRFRHAGDVSPAGRARTLPEGRVDEFRIAAFSCANYPAGFFNAYRDAAGRGDIDLVLHLGDYLYEYPMGGYATEDAERLSRVPDPKHEIVSYEDYARRHAQYCLDPDLQALKAAAAFAPVWDDHETANNAYRTGAENHQPDEGDWVERRDAALAAWRAWLPVRESDPMHARSPHLRIGELGTVLLLETRLTARSDEIDWTSFPVPADADPDDPEVRAAVRRWREDVIGDPDRTLLGEDQFARVAATLADSAARGEPWRIFANQVIMGRTDAPNYAEVTPFWLRWAMRMRGGQVWDYVLRSRFDVPITMDDWNGFPAERERLYAAARAAGADFITLTGDSHCHWCLDLHDEAGTRVGTEFGVTSVTSPSDYEMVAAPGVDFGAYIVERNPEVLHQNPYERGYLVLTLRREEAIAELISVSTIKARDFSSHVDTRWRVLPAGSGDVPQVERLD